MKSAFASLLILLTLCIQVATTSPELHQWLHAESENSCNPCCAHNSTEDETPEQAEHQCAVNLMAGGIALFVFETRPPVISFIRTEAETYEYAAYLHRVEIRERSRGPPILS